MDSLRKGNETAYLDESFEDIVVETEITVPHTNIQNRAKIVDLSKDLKPRMGVERIMTQDIFEIQDEFGENGEKVFGAVGDKYGQIRFVGGWRTLFVSTGTFSFTSTAGDYAEITFYGTGLNVLTSTDAAKNYQKSVDGGSALTFFDGTNTSSILNSRNYAPNNIISVSRNLTLGWHTIKVIQNGNDILFMGIEILNESTQLVIPEGNAFVNKKLVNMSPAQLIDYDSGFESGVLGTKGGRVVTYLKEDGSVGKAVNPVDVTARYMTNTDHSNEEIVRRYNFREFGCGRDDDFSTLAGTTVDRAFTLDDNTTTLIGDNVVIPSGTNEIYSSSGHITLTFIGTGLDIAISKVAVAGHLHDCYIDGVNKGDINFTDSDIVTICSGLPYGTHTAQFLEVSGAGDVLRIKDFIVYQPKKPTIPTNTIELSEYNVLADFVGNTSGLTHAVSQGTIRKSGAREKVFTGTWSMGMSVNTPMGSYPYTSTNNDSFEEVFYGTGIVLMGSMAADSWIMRIDGLNDFDNQGWGIETNNGFTVNTTNGVITGTASANPTIIITGLPLGIHTLHVDKGSPTDLLRVFCTEVITPIYFPKQNKYPVQGAIEVGNNALGDSRKLKAVEIEENKPNFNLAKGKAGVTTTSTEYIPLTDMITTITTKGNPIEITFNGSFKATSASIYGSIILDGKNLAPGGDWYGNLFMLYSGSSSRVPATASIIVNAGPGQHTIQVVWRLSAGTGYEDNARILTVKEL